MLALGVKKIVIFINFFRIFVTIAILNVLGECAFVRLRSERRRGGTSI